MTTKICPNCGSTTISELRSVNLKKCLNCGHEYDWPLDDGQESLDATARGKRKPPTAESKPESGE